ncbi:hypothetical protein BDR26DRAFT_873800 [Obelidium mucronatum]|nr:hypothetical protein BDR26DRAFT_873800 [Obelidium mucronatum]
MNVYCPGGFFKPHCDTPRATSMFGSLVVCLPLEHAGGDLVVRHKGKTVVFDWGNRIQQDLQQQQQQKNAETGGELAPPSIHWAAFFSDCEHEILPVQSGLRVTITYNLHLVETKVDDVICPPVDSNSLGPFHTLLAESLKDPSFMPKGGTLGFGLQHQYPMGLNVPERIFSLKGNDLLVHKSATDLGIGVRIMAAYNVDDDEDSEDDLENDPDNDSDDEDGNNEADNDIAKKKPSKTSPTVDAFKQYRPSFNRYISGILISDCFSGGGGDYEERSTKSILKDEVDAIHDKSIKWVHYPSHEELASTYMTYGNEASVAYIYVSGCMLLDIPSLADRKDSR